MRQDIIDMAREADIDWHRHWNDDETNRLEIFAQLVEQRQREEFAKKVEAMPFGDTGASFAAWLRFMA